MSTREGKTINDTGDDSESVSAVNIVSDFIKDVSVPKLMLGAVMGAAAGAALSFVNQTLVNPPKEITLPFEEQKLAYLRRYAPELLHAINEYYEFRRFVDKDEYLPLYDQKAEILVDSTSTIVALYNEIRQLRRDLGFTQEFHRAHIPPLMQLRTQLKVALEVMSQMPYLLTNHDMIQVKTSFNYLHSLYCDRLHQLKMISEGVTE